MTDLDTVGWCQVLVSGRFAQAAGLIRDRFRVRTPGVFRGSFSANPTRCMLVYKARFWWLLTPPRTGSEEQPASEPPQRATKQASQRH